MEAVFNWSMGTTEAAPPSTHPLPHIGYRGVAGATASRSPVSGWMRTKLLDADVQIVDRCLAGDDSAWEELIRTHSRRVYGICYRFTGSDTESQDLAQEVFLRLYKSLASFRPKEGSFQVWLARLTRNLLIDHYRKTRMQRATDSIEEQLPVLEQKGSAGNRTDALLVGRETGELIQQALARLSPELRETVILRDLEEMEYREIAQVLQVPEGTVKSRLNRGRAELARLLRKHRLGA